MSEKCCTFKVKFGEDKPMDVKFGEVQVAGSKKGTVLYDREQSLTEEEQAQARGNIGAVSADEVEGAIDSLGNAVAVELQNKITSPQVAAVGDVLTVEEVDEDGKPTKWKTSEQVQADMGEFKTTAQSYVVGKTHYHEKEHEVLVIPANASDEIFYPDEQLKTGDAIYYLKDPTGKMENSELFSLNALPSDFAYVSGYARVQRLTFPVRLEITNLAGVELVLCQKAYTKKISSDYLPFASYSVRDGYSPGVVKCSGAGSSNKNYYSRVVYDEDNVLFSETETLFKDTFDLTSDELLLNKTVTCLKPGALSESFPEVPAAAYPVTLFMTSNGVYFKFSNGVNYSASSYSGKDGAVTGFTGVTETTDFLKKEYEEYLVKNSFPYLYGNSNTTVEIAPLGLVEGRRYIATYTTGGGNPLTLEMTAEYSDVLGMVACFSNGNTTADDIKYNWFYIGDTQFYMNSSWMNAYHGCSVRSLYGYRLKATIPAEMINGTVGCLHITITTTVDEDGNIIYTCDKTGTEIAEACTNGTAVVEYDGYVYTLNQSRGDWFEFINDTRLNNWTERFWIDISADGEVTIEYEDEQTEVAHASFSIVGDQCYYYYEAVWNLLSAFLDKFDFTQCSATLPALSATVIDFNEEQNNIDCFRFLGAGIINIDNVNEQLTVVFEDLPKNLRYTIAVPNDYQNGVYGDYKKQQTSVTIDLYPTRLTGSRRLRKSLMVLYRGTTRRDFPRWQDTRTAEHQARL